LIKNIVGRDTDFFLVLHKILSWEKIDHYNW